MLVLTRKISERIVILLPNNQEIVLTLVQAEYDKARLGFDAPKDVKIFREEIIKDRK